ncbi:MAG: DUF5688 family protein [Lachnospiraceae bacterium]|nr:DUF5688 family protein [Lachnospiraceae bacterium]
MNYNSFKEAVIKRLTADIPNPKHILIQKVRRNNGEFLDALVILEDGVNIGPTLYLNHYYSDVAEGLSFSAVYRKIVNCYENNKTTKRIDVGFFTDFHRIRSRLMIKLIHREKNRGFLREDVPHIPFLDLAIVIYGMFPVDPDIGNATILIDNSHLALWETSMEELFPIAMENSRKFLPPQLESLHQVLRDLTDMPGYPTIPVADDPLFPMYVLTNEQNLFGAACMVYDGLLKSYAGQFGSDLYILPSSIHEVILVPFHGIDRMEEFSAMVREVNETQVAPEDILSDHAYYYSLEEDRLHG